MIFLEQLAPYFSPILTWVECNPAWSGLAIFFISLCESLVVIGLFIPGIFMMSSIGSLVAAGVLTMKSTLLWAISGAVVGDYVSYIVGFSLKEGLYNTWPFYKVPSWLDKGKKFFFKHGSLSIIIGRFIGPVRPFIPVVAGMMNMSPKKFFVANLVSAVLWAPIFMFPGFWLAKFFV